MKIIDLILTSESVAEAPEELFKLSAVEDAVLVEIEQLIQALQVVEFLIVDLELLL